MNTLRSVVIFFILTILFVSSSFGKPTSYLPISHRAYDFLERMEHHYLLSGAKLGAKPFTRAETARLIFSLYDKRKLLSKVDRDELECLIDEFKPDFQTVSGLVWDDRGAVEFLPGIFVLALFFYL